MAKIILEKERIISGGGVSLSEYLGQTIQNSESKLIVFKGQLYKILEEDLAQNRQVTMEFFHEYKDEFSTSLEDLVYENGRFYAYSMKLLENYQTLHAVLKSDVSLSLRKKICLLIIRTMQKLESYHKVYYDLHSKNFMVGKDLRILDIDSTLETTDIRYIVRMRQNLLQLCVSVLSGVDFDFDTIDFSKLKEDSFLESLILGDEMVFRDLIPLAYDFIIHYVEEYTPSMQEKHAGMILKIAR